MLAALLIAQVFAVGIPPALPPPPTPEAIRAARALYPTNPLDPQNSWGISIAAAQVAGDALRARGLTTRERDTLLSDRLRDRAREAEAEIIDAAIACIADPLATRLSAHDLRALGAFIATPEGANYWRITSHDNPGWQACFRAPVERHLAASLEADVTAVVREAP